MIAHLAVFRWKPDVTQEQVDELTVALRDMATKIAVLRSYVVGPNLHLRPGGSDYAVTALVDDAAGLEAYLDHPEHLAVLQSHLVPMIAERNAVQLPLADGSSLAGAS